MSSFPTVAQLWHGSLLGTIAHAIWLVQHPDFSHEQSWDGINYSVQDSQGTRGTITFSGKNVVGVFRDENSSRNPLPSESEYDLGRYFAEAPSKLLTLAENEALHYVLEEYKGKVVPVITSAFWGKGKVLTASESWDEVFTHGAHVIRIQALGSTEDAIDEWQENYEMNPSQVSLMRSLLKRRLAKPDSELVLNKKELEILTADGKEGLEECQELLAGIGITLPNNI